MTRLTSQWYNYEKDYYVSLFSCNQTWIVERRIRSKNYKNRFNQYGQAISFLNMRGYEQLREVFSWRNMPRIDKT